MYGERIAPGMISILVGLMLIDGIERKVVKARR